MIVWHEEQDKDLRDQTLEERGSVKHKSNSIRNTCKVCTSGTAQDN